ncbi:unnamed protein product [Meganyctiphanes norvegica]|uniref:Major facilitator superfamily (MFS) profile domain-containing protein n=1 Tax=Meganyctiphanes norvegica TaxID=48144 RepID=A0AAV2Q0G5_MEGNR
MKMDDSNLKNNIQQENKSFDKMDKGETLQSEEKKNNIVPEDVDTDMTNWKKNILESTNQNILNPKTLRSSIDLYKNDLSKSNSDSGQERNIETVNVNDNESNKTDVFAISVRPKNVDIDTSEGKEPPAGDVKHLTAAEIINLWKKPDRTTSLTASLTDPEAKGTARKLPQVLACLAAATGQLSSGAVNGWSGAALPSISADPKLTVGTPQRALIVSCIGLGALVGCLCAGQVNNLIGRRTTLVLTSPLLLAGWLTLAFAQDMAGVYMGRLLCGLSTGFLFTTCQVYSSEVPEPKLRGRLGTIPSLLLTVGVLLSYIAGGLLPWRQSCYVCAIPSFFLLLFMLMVPESPYWLILKGRREEANKALRWLRGPDYDVDVELKEMEIKIEAVGRHTSIRELWHPRTRLPFIISLFMQTLQQVCGANILMMFTGSIFQASGASIGHEMATIYTGIGQLVVTIISVCLVDILGRRLLIVGATTLLV